jgi:hypothetical protein
MSFQGHLNLNADRRDLAVAFVKTTQVQASTEDLPGLGFAGPTVQYVNEQFGMAGLMELWLTGLAAVNPKVFRCDLDWESIDQIELRIPLSDYEQPFDTVVVEFPKTYGEHRKCSAGRPDFAVLHRIGSRLAIMIVYDTAMAITEHLSSTEGTIEDKLRMATILTLQPGSLPIQEDENATTINATRAAINLMLLVMNEGHRTVRTRDEKYRMRLEKSIRLGKGAEHARGELERLPDFFALDRKVKLFEDKRERSETGEPTGRTTAPHWRRGHWRMQPYGPELSQRKRVLIKAMRIHPELFGERAGTTTYVGQPAAE